MVLTKADTKIDMMAHLMRRAGFGASREELESRSLLGYEETVEELLAPSLQDPVDRYQFLRYYPMWWKPGTMGGLGQAEWVWTMISTKAPLQEKMCLFYHNIFATGVAKVDHYDEIQDMIDMFRDKGLGKYKEILMEVAKSPAMIYWLDNNENHADSVNENWGRELLELFTMGVGNYTETDVRECSRAFTGWTLEHKLPRFHMGRWDWEFKFIPEDHDYTDKEFLGHTGNFDGEEIIDIILSKPATAQFIARHLYSFFVADEPQVPAWSVTPPNDPKAVDFLAEALMASDYHMGTVLQKLFTSDFFKEQRFSRVKNPTEVVISTLRLVGGTNRPSPETLDWTGQIAYMGQDLLNPPSVEGWHNGIEWINSGTLMKRTNFVSELISDTERPGVRNIIDRIKLAGSNPINIIDACLDIMGPMEVSDQTRRELIDHSEKQGDFDWNSDGEEKLIEVLQLLVATREYQFA
ncbi:MAG: DUF1800 domain-containing protein [SAR202 cluster bacterium]|nr:DUF1800 domain-containing protein [SAR202 cluster bacterium]